ncbi:MAG: hypothetical protein IPJ41_08770 [Phycisphaerales bacterium]|nr:hypothetical protein [Phycisphaerales bacterium]
MSGITSGVGLFSGIDTASLIDQLLAIEARPRDLAKQRILQLQIQQSAYLDLNSRMSALRNATKAFRTDFIFDSMGVSSSNDSVLAATASRTATPGVYSFLVDRLVSSQQMLSKGFADKDATAVNASSFTFESAEGRRDRDTALADLNDGEGVERGKVVITVGAETQTIDLSKAVTVSDVLDAINASGLDLTASVSDDHFVLTAGSGSETVSISNAVGYTTAESLGIAGSGTGAITGDSVYRLTGSTTLNELNDGNGIFVADTLGGHDFDITANGSTAAVNLGTIYDSNSEVVAGPVTTVQGVLDRINSALTTAGMDSDVSVAIVGGSLKLTNAQNTDIQIAESGSGVTAHNLGIFGTGSGGTLTGTRIFSGLNTTLVANLNGGSGIAGDGMIDFTARDGTSFSVDVSAATTVDELVSIVNNDSGNAGRITLSLNGPGSGLKATDSTGASTSNLIISGDAATSLGIATDTGGVASDAVTGTSVQHKYVAMSTRVSKLNGGKGIGTGEFRVTDGDGVSFKVDIGSDTQTVFDLVKEINAQASAQGANVLASLNEKGDGIVIKEDPGKTAGAGAIKVEDISGTVAKSLKIAGEAKGRAPTTTSMARQRSPSTSRPPTRLPPSPRLSTTGAPGSGPRSSTTAPAAIPTG